MSAYAKKRVAVAARFFIVRRYDFCWILSLPELCETHIIVMIFMPNLNPRLFVVALLFWPMVASAALTNSTVGDSNLGKPCWDDGNGKNYLLIKCMPKAAFFVSSEAYTYCTLGYGYELQEDDDAWLETGLNCIAKVSSDAVYLCSNESAVDGACAAAAIATWNKAYNEELTWSANGTNRQCASYPEYVPSSYSGWAATLRATGKTSYKCGCNSGYYRSSGNQYSFDTVCSACPTYNGNATAVTDNPNFGELNSCCLPKGTGFSDTTGSGSYTNKCCAS